MSTRLDNKDSRWLVKHDFRACLWRTLEESGIWIRTESKDRGWAWFNLGKTWMEHQEGGRPTLFLLQLEQPISGLGGRSSKVPGFLIPQPLIKWYDLNQNWERKTPVSGSNLFCSLSSSIPKTSQSLELTLPTPLASQPPAPTHTHARTRRFPDTGHMAIHTGTSPSLWVRLSAEHKQHKYTASAKWTKNEMHKLSLDGRVIFHMIYFPLGWKGSLTHCLTFPGQSMNLRPPQCVRCVRAFSKISRFCWFCRVYASLAL